MLNINKVMLTGRLTRDPETKYLPSGQAVTQLSVAVSRNFKDKNGEWKEDTSFIDVEVWGQAAERAAETLRKGRPVFVEGRLKQDTWEKDGQKQSKIRVSADRVTGFDVPTRGSADGGGHDDGGDFGGGGSSAPRQSRPSSRPSSGGRTQPSDGVDFDNAPIEDDIPF
jgi:single-strand DNA-binding protein